MDVSQVVILFCSCASIWAFASKRHHYLGFVFGLIGQPFWIYTSFQAAQWGIFIVSLWYTANHIRGLINNR